MKSKIAFAVIISITFTVCTSILGQGANNNADQIIPGMSGSLSGHVYEFGGATPVEGATVSILGLTDTTDGSGYYFIDGIPNGTWDATASYPGYCDQTVSGIEITPGGNTLQDFGLTWAEITTVPDPSLGIVVYVPENQNQTVPLTIYNPGTCTLDFDFDFVVTQYGLKTGKSIESQANGSHKLNVSAIEQFGGTNYMFTNGNSTIGNIYKVETETLLNEHKLWMNVPATTQMWFLVYENTTLSGTYTLISACDVSPAGPGGPGWQSSGPVEVMMWPEHFYLICTSFEQPCSYYCDQNITPYPIPASFGTLVSSVGFDWTPATSFPPEMTLSVPLFVPEAVAFYQEITTNEGPVWCSLMDYNNYTGSIPAGGSETIPVTFDATGFVQGTTKTGILTINSNARNNNALTMNVTMIVGTPQVGNLDGYIFEFGTTTPVAGAIVTIDDGVTGPQSVYTNLSGYYDFPGVYLLFPITFEACKEGFCCIQDMIYPWETADFWQGSSIEEWGLPWAELDFQPQALDVYVIEGQSKDFIISLTNPGSCELDYEGTISMITDYQYNSSDDDDPWLSIAGGATGTILPFNNETAQMVIHCDAGEFSQGTIKSGEIIINSNARWNPQQPIPVTMHVTQGETLDLKALLEGAYDPSTGEMSNELNPAGLLPFSQPYGPSLPYYGNPAPEWLYNGLESVTAINPDVVDWLLLEVRDAPDAQNATSATTKDILPVFLLKNGAVTNLEGNGNPTTSASIDDGMFVVVHHRNHVSIMNPVPVPENMGVYTWDFTSGIYGGVLGAKEVAPGVWAMMGGDGNGDAQINTQDKLDAWWPEAGNSGYRGGDFNMNGQTGNQDKVDIWQPNSGQSSQVPE